MSLTAAKTFAVASAAMFALAVPAFSAAPLSACTIMTKAEVKPYSTNRLFDQFPPEEEKVGNGTGCNYAGVLIQLDPFPFATVENLRRQQGQMWETASGIGDIAYVRNNGNEYAELYARVGQRVFTIQMDVGPQENFASVKPRLLRMGTALAAKLR